MIAGITHLVESGPLLLAMPVAAAAGAITFLSPCCLPLVPGYLSYLTGMSGDSARARAGAAVTAAAGPASAVAAAAGAVPAAAGAGSAGTVTVRAPGAAAVPAAPDRGRAVLGTLLFVIGFSVVFAAEAVAFGAAGAALLLHQRVVSEVLGSVIIVLGLMFAGAFDRFSFSGRIFRPQFRPRAGLAGAPLLGMLFGLSWTPCIGPTLAAVLSLGTSTGSPSRAVLLAFVYALGLGVPFLIVASAVQRGMSLFAFARRHGRLISQIGGAMLIAVGLLEVTGAWQTALTWLQVHWLAGYNTPI